MQVTFNDEQQSVQQPPKTYPQSRMVSFLLKKKIVKTEQQGYVVLLGVVMLCILSSLLFLRSGSTDADVDDKYYYDPLSDGG